MSSVRYLETLLQHLHPWKKPAKTSRTTLLPGVLQ